MTNNIIKEEESFCFFFTTLFSLKGDTAEERVRHKILTLDHSNVTCKTCLHEPPNYVSPCLSCGHDKQCHHQDSLSNDSMSGNHFICCCWTVTENFHHFRHRAVFQKLFSFGHILSLKLPLGIKAGVSLWKMIKRKEG